MSKPGESWSQEDYDRAEVILFSENPSPRKSAALEEAMGNYDAIASGGTEDYALGASMPHEPPAEPLASFESEVPAGSYEAPAEELPPITEEENAALSPPLQAQPTYDPGTGLDNAYYYQEPTLDDAAAAIDAAEKEHGRSNETILARSNLLEEKENSMFYMRYANANYQKVYEAFHDAGQPLIREAKAPVRMERTRYGVPNPLTADVGRRMLQNVAGPLALGFDTTAGLGLGREAVATGLESAGDPTRPDVMNEVIWQLEREGTLPSVDERMVRQRNESPIPSLIGGYYGLRYGAGALIGKGIDAIGKVAGRAGLDTAVEGAHLTKGRLARGLKVAGLESPRWAAQGAFAAAAMGLGDRTSAELGKSARSTIGRAQELGEVPPDVAGPDLNRIFDPEAMGLDALTGAGLGLGLGAIGHTAGGARALLRRKAPSLEKIPIVERGRGSGTTGPWSGLKEGKMERELREEARRRGLRNERPEDLNDLAAERVGLNLAKRGSDASKRMFERYEAAKAPYIEANKGKVFHPIQTFDEAWGAHSVRAGGVQTGSDAFRHARASMSKVEVVDGRSMEPRGRGKQVFTVQEAVEGGLAKEVTEALKARDMKLIDGVAHRRHMRFPRPGTYSRPGEPAAAAAPVHQGIRPVEALPGIPVSRMPQPPGRPAVAGPPAATYTAGESEGSWVASSPRPPAYQSAPIPGGAPIPGIRQAQQRPFYPRPPARPSVGVRKAGAPPRPPVGRESWTPLEDGQLWIRVTPKGQRGIVTFEESVQGLGRKANVELEKGAKDKLWERLDAAHRKDRGQISDGYAKLKQAEGEEIELMEAGAKALGAERFDKLLRADSVESLMRHTHHLVGSGATSAAARKALLDRYFIENVDMARAIRQEGIQVAEDYRSFVTGREMLGLGSTGSGTRVPNLEYQMISRVAPKAPRWLDALLGKASRTAPGLLRVHGRDSDAKAIQMTWDEVYSAATEAAEEDERE